jgi:pimeloyl-ACP methyl ester carboxylesterase
MGGPSPARTSVGATPAASASPTPTVAVGLDDCVPNAWRTLQLRSRDGVRLAAAQTGHGQTGVVFAHESDGTLCNWVPYAASLARRGVQVLVLDGRGHGSSADAPAPRSAAWDLDVEAAAVALRRSGVTRIALVGASAGGTAALVAAVRVPSITAVASLSGPAEFAAMDAARAATQLQTPALYLVGALDSGFVPDARRLADRTRGPHQLTIVPDDGWHGTALLDDPIRGTKLAALLTDFLLHALRPTG